MKKNLAASVLTVFVYAQGLLCVAAVATVVLRHQPTETSQASSEAQVSQASVVAIRL